MSRDSVRSFVYRVVDIFPGALKTPARWVADRVFGVWDEIYGVMALFRPTFLWLQHGIQNFITSQLRFVKEVANTFKWLVVTQIPNWGRWALNNAINWTTYQVGLIRTWAEATIETARRALSKAISAVDAFMRSTLQWTIDRVREIWATLSVIRDRVVALLSNPETLVDWLFAALWRRFWRFANDHAEAIAGTIWTRRDTIITKAMFRLENWLMRIL